VAIVAIVVIGREFLIVMRFSVQKGRGEGVSAKEWFVMMIRTFIKKDEMKAQ